MPPPLSAHLQPRPGSGTRVPVLPPSLPGSPHSSLLSPGIGPQITMCTQALAEILLSGDPDQDRGELPHRGRSARLAVSPDMLDTQARLLLPGAPCPWGRQRCYSGHLGCESQVRGPEAPLNWHGQFPGLLVETQQAGAHWHQGKAALPLWRVTPPPRGAAAQKPRVGRHPRK